MTKGRMEAFSDGVLAIVITIMVLEIKVPHEGEGFEALVPLLPVFLSYVLSFIYLGIYWNNHHHMMHTVKKDFWKNALGQPSPALLAFLDPLCDRLDGRKPFCKRTDGAVRTDLADGGHFLFHTPKDHHTITRP